MTGQTDPQPDRQARILIVDDEPLNVDYLEQELESRGFATETAADGLEALERVAATPPDLVLLDVMMPGMDGISALRILKGDPETRLIPVSSRPPSTSASSSRGSGRRSASSARSTRR